MCAKLKPFLQAKPFGKASRDLFQKDWWFVLACYLFSVLGVDTLSGAISLIVTVSWDPGLQSQSVRGQPLGSSCRNQGTRCSQKFPARRYRLSGLGSGEGEDGMHQLEQGGGRVLRCLLPLPLKLGSVIGQGQQGGNNRPGGGVGGGGGGV